MEKKQIPWVPIFLFSTIFIGFISRLYLSLTLPIWHDEAYSIWASTTPFFRIITGFTDPVHTPGYYLLLKVWSFVSMHLFWMRLNTLLFFLLNTLILYQLGRKIRNATYGSLLVFFYIFSGYFLLFDWNVRMYTFIDTCILLSLFFLLKKQYILFGLINIVGLYSDYAFLWYFLPLGCIYVFYSFIKNDKEKYIPLKIIVVDTILFILLYPNMILFYQRGIEGIRWMEPYWNPAFFIPYFLGSHDVIPMTVVLWILFIIGGYQVFVKKCPFTIRLILLSAVISLAGTLLSVLTPFKLFHIRSLQIVPLGFIFCFSECAMNIRTLWKKIILIFILILFIGNYFTHAYLLPIQPGKYIISFFPWKSVIKNLTYENGTTFNILAHNLPITYLLRWGLMYSLNGNEVLFSKKYAYKEIQSYTELTPNCAFVYRGLIDIFSCPSHYSSIGRY